MGPAILIHSPPAKWQILFIVAGEHVRRRQQLFVVVQIDALLRPVLGITQRWQEHRGQDRDDGDHDKKFDQRESSRLAR